VQYTDDDRVAWFADRFEAIASNIERVIQGKRPVVNQVLMCLVAEGHVLVEDVPGVGKTALAKSLARSIDCTFNRIQFTPDLLPSDVTGVSVWDRHTSEFSFKPGAIFANIVVGDEINRASPKTQSALLEAMEERQVTVDGATRELSAPFMVVATQNPLEHEGTYPLPEAQLDRFMMRVEVGYPDRGKELEMLDTHAVRSTYHDLTPVVHADDVLQMIDIARRVHVEPSVKGYIVDVVGATRGHGEVLLGASPRSSLFLQRASRARAAIDGRDYVTPDDVKAVAIPILEHRMALRPEATMRGLRLREVIDSILKSLRVPSATRLA
jgi:MoxR-like ATPase